MWDWNWWRGREADSLAKRLGRKASRGDIIVIHDGHHVDPKADRRHAAETVRRLIPALRARGFSFGTVCSPATAAAASSDRLIADAIYFFR
jgi:peptidoglycan/xylan/chitin deacetylase (PgdA/CDA1 family)